MPHGHPVHPPSPTPSGQNPPSIALNIGSPPRASVSRDADAQPQFPPQQGFPGSQQPSSRASIGDLTPAVGTLPFAPSAIGMNGMARAGSQNERQQSSSSARAIPSLQRHSMSGTLHSSVSALLTVGFGGNSACSLLVADTIAWCLHLPVTSC